MQGRKQKTLIRTFLPSLLVATLWACGTEDLHLDTEALRQQQDEQSSTAQLSPGGVPPRQVGGTSGKEDEIVVAGTNGSALCADLDDNACVDSMDLGYIIENWGAALSCTNDDSCHCLDQDGNGQVGATDLNMVLAAWGQGAGCPDVDEEDASDAPENDEDKEPSDPKAPSTGIAPGEIDNPGDKQDDIIVASAGDGALENPNEGDNDKDDRGVKGPPGIAPGENEE